MKVQAIEMGSLLIILNSISIGIISVMFVYYYKNHKKTNNKLQLIDEIVQYSSQIICKIDCDGKILYINKMIEDLLGYDEKILNLSKISTVIHEEDQRKIQQLFNTFRPNVGCAKFELRIKHKKGYYVWMYIEVKPVLDSKKQKIANILYCEDITTKKLTYMDLVKSQRKFYQLFQGIQDAIFIEPFSTDYRQSVFLQFNKAACENFGYEEYECKKMCLAKLDVQFIEGKESKASKTQEELLEILLKNKKVIYETEYINKKGEMIPVEVCDNMFNLSNTPIIMTIVRDISERNVIKEAKKLERIKSDFLANVSHELRTPLNVIITTLQLLEINMQETQGQKEELDLKIKKYTTIMKQNALRLLKLVNNFVSMAKIESGFYKANRSPCNIVALVEDISQSIISYIEGNGISFEFDTDVEEKLVSCDIEMIEKIMLNLISNAVKFTKTGGSLLIHIIDRGKTVQIKVKDSGIGIPEDKQKIIFERFRQVDKTFTRMQEGCGIGLYLVEYFIKMHEGSIEVSSEEGKGTTFIIELPTLNEDEIIGEISPYNFKNEGDTLYHRALEFSDIYKNVD